MIILQTGVPGSGKTASVVAMLMGDESYTHFIDKDGVKKKRPLFVNGISELMLEHTELDDEQIRAQPLQDFLPYGSLVVIDEVQRLMGTRSAASKVPHYIEALATHRHHGLDIILITQHPSFLDPFVRKLVQRHMHISIKSIGRKLYEWNECIDQPDSATNIAKAVERQFKVPKQAFDKYKSAEVHTKPKRKLPLVVIFLAVFLPVLIVFGFYTLGRVKSRFDASPQEQAASAVAASDTVADVGGLVDAPAPATGQSLTADMFTPTIPEKPESKPLYDGVRQVKTFERVAACVKGGQTGCTCYSDQATPLIEISKAQCLKYVKNGLPFDPYREPPQEPQPQQAAEPQQETQLEQLGQQVITLSGEPKMPKSQDYPKRLQDIQ